jgi:hypothetical protein
MLIIGASEQLVDAATLKAVRIANIETIVNHPNFGVTPDERKELITAGHFVAAEFKRLDAAISAALDRTTPLTRQADFLGRLRSSQRNPLTRPDGSDPDGFSRRVAEAYYEAVVVTTKPATVLAEEAGVPVTTVHRWIRDARQRGHITAARKGRAG